MAYLLARSARIERERQKRIEEEELKRQEELRRQLSCRLCVNLSA